MPEDAVDRVERIVTAIATAIDPDAEVRLEERGDEIFVEIDCDDPGRLIGRHGNTIDAVQHLAYRTAFHDRPADRGIVVDVDGYREQRADQLRGQADRGAEQALRTGDPVPLSPMNAIERKLVHEYLRDRHDIETYSEGVEPDRRLVVAPVVD